MKKLRRGDLVTVYRHACRLLRRRKVTMYAMPRYDDYEWRVELLDGSMEPCWVGESEITTAEERDQTEEAR